MKTLQGMLATAALVAAASAQYNGVTHADKLVQTIQAGARESAMQIMMHSSTHPSSMSPIHPLHTIRSLIADSFIPTACVGEDGQPLATGCCGFFSSFQTHMQNNEACGQYVHINGGHHPDSIEADLESFCTGCGDTFMELLAEYSSVAISEPACGLLQGFFVPQGEILCAMGGSDEFCYAELYNIRKISNCEVDNELDMLFAGTIKNDVMCNTATDEGSNNYGPGSGSAGGSGSGTGGSGTGGSGTGGSGTGGSGTGGSGMSGSGMSGSGMHHEHSRSLQEPQPEVPITQSNLDIICGGCGPAIQSFISANEQFVIGTLYVQLAAATTPEQQATITGDIGLMEMHQGMVTGLFDYMCIEYDDVYCITTTAMFPGPPSGSPPSGQAQNALPLDYLCTPCGRASTQYIANVLSLMGANPNQAQPSTPPASSPQALQQNLHMVQQSRVLQPLFEAAASATGEQNGPSPEDINMIYNVLLPTIQFGCGTAPNGHRCGEIMALIDRNVNVTVVQEAPISANPFDTATCDMGTLLSMIDAMLATVSSPPVQASQRQILYVVYNAMAMNPTNFGPDDIQAIIASMAGVIANPMSVTEEQMNSVTLCQATCYDAVMDFSDEWGCCVAPSIQLINRFKPNVANEMKATTVNVFSVILSAVAQALSPSGIVIEVPSEEVLYAALPAEGPQLLSTPFGSCGIDVNVNAVCMAAIEVQLSISFTNLNFAWLDDTSFPERKTAFITSFLTDFAIISGVDVAFLRVAGIRSGSVIVDVIMQTDDAALTTAAAARVTQQLASGNVAFGSIETFVTVSGSDALIPGAIGGATAVTMVASLPAASSSPAPTPSTTPSTFPTTTPTNAAAEESAPPSKSPRSTTASSSSASILLSVLIAVCLAAMRATTLE